MPTQKIVQQRMDEVYEQIRRGVAAWGIELVPKTEESVPATPDLEVDIREARRGKARLVLSRMYRHDGSEPCVALVYFYDEQRLNGLPAITLHYYATKDPAQEEAWRCHQQRLLTVDPAGKAVVQVLVDKPTYAESTPGRVNAVEYICRVFLNAPPEE